MLAAALLTGLAVISWRVEVAEGLDCPDQAAVERALARRGPPGREGWAVQLAPAPDAAALQVTLRQSGGPPALERSISRTGTTCESTAEAIALVVERYFREVTWSRPAPPVVERVVAPAPARPPDERPRLLLLAGPMLRTGTASPGVAAELRVRVFGPVHLGTGLLFPAASDQEALPAGGQAELRSWSFQLRGLTEGRRGAWAALAGLDAAVDLQRGTSRAVRAPASKRRAVLGAGGSVGLAWLPTRRLRLALEAGLTRFVAGPGFEVEGYGPVLAPPRWQGLVALRLGWALWP